MDEEHVLEGSLAGPREVDQLAGVRVAREGADVDDLRLDRDVDPEDSHLRTMLDQLAAERVPGLEADDQDRVPLVLDVVPEVMYDAPRLAHPRRRDDDRGALQ